MPKFIYAIEVNNGPVGTCLDLIRLLSNPAARRYSHLTVRGPFGKPMGIEERTALEGQIIPLGITIDGTGHFFDDGQNTVFFGCSAPFLKQIWKKADYGFKPHVTIYNGNDHDFAVALYEVISRHEYDLRCGKGRFEEYDLEANRNGLLRNLIKLTDLPETLRLATHLLHELDALTTDVRLDMIGSICVELSRLQQKKLLH